MLDLTNQQALATSAQRWRARASLFRPAQEPMDPSIHGVEVIGKTEAKEFVIQHHYSGSFPYEMNSVGLFRKDGDFLASRLVGVASFSTPSNPNSITRWSGLGTEEGAELGRFVLLDEVEGNAETWFLARALRLFKAQRPGIRVVLSYSDPHPRRNAAGKIVFPGHIGGVYSASNALFCGRASPKTLYLTPDGKAIANRILSKLRNGEEGRAYAERMLTEATGCVREELEEPSAYVERALATLRVERHAGNYLFVFPLAADRREKKAVLSLPVLRSHSLGIDRYPKQVDPLQSMRINANGTCELLPQLELAI